MYRVVKKCFSRNCQIHKEDNALECVKCQQHMILMHKCQRDFFATQCGYKSEKSEKCWLLTLLPLQPFQSCVFIFFNNIIRVHVGIRSLSLDQSEVESMIKFGHWITLDIAQSISVLKDFVKNNVDLFMDIHCNENVYMQFHRWTLW